MSKYSVYINKYQDDLLKDLDTLVRIPSVSDETNPVDKKPFGEGVAHAFEAFEDIAKRLGFEVEHDEGYAISANYLDGEDYVGVLGHLDIIDAHNREDWKYDPYKLTVKNGILYGRGVNDDKGPLLINLYAVRILRDMGCSFKRPVKVIAGGAEETTWNCMKHYFETHKQPLMGYSPDGNFPIVNGEKGILTFEASYPKEDSVFKVVEIRGFEQDYMIPGQIELRVYCENVETLSSELKNAFNDHEAIFTFTGKQALTRNPQRAVNPLFELADFVQKYSVYFDGGLMALLRDIAKYLKDPYGQDCNIYYEDADMGKTSIAAYMLQMKEDSYSVRMDLRYPKGIDPLQIESSLHVLFPSLKKIRKKRLLFVPKESELIQKLADAYYSVTQEKTEPITKGGASYARVLDCGIAFGATFAGYDTKCHQPNESMPLDDLLRALEIYCEAIYLLACE